MNSVPIAITIAMRVIAFSLSVLFCAISLTSAVPWDSAPSTAPSPSLGWNSNPTPKPLPAVGEREPYDLLRRQVSATSTICGYINGLTSSSVTCFGSDTTICSPLSKNSVLGCCDNDGFCNAFTECLNSFEVSALCPNSSTCFFDPRTRLCNNSSRPYCRRYTHSGYSVFVCATYPGAVSLSMTFFSSPTRVSAETITVTTTGEPRSLKAGTIAGSVIGGLVILVAAAVGLSYMLRRPSPPTHVPALGPVMAETSSPSSRYTTSHTSSTPLYGQFQDMPREIHGQPQQLPEMGTGR